MHLSAQSSCALPGKSRDGRGGDTVAEQASKSTTSKSRAHIRSGLSLRPCCGVRFSAIICASSKQLARRQQQWVLCRAPGALRAASNSSRAAAHEVQQLVLLEQLLRDGVLLGHVLQERPDRILQLLLAQTGRGHHHLGPGRRPHGTLWLCRQPVPSCSAQNSLHRAWPQKVGRLRYCAGFQTRCTQKPERVLTRASWLWAERETKVSAAILLCAKMGNPAAAQAAGSRLLWGASLRPSSCSAPLQAHCTNSPVSRLLLRSSTVVGAMDEGTHRQLAAGSQEASPHLEVLALCRGACPSTARLTVRVHLAVTTLSTPAKSRTDSKGCCYGPHTPEGDCTQAPAFTWRPTCAAVLCGPGLDAPALQRWLADGARGGAAVSVLDAAACLAAVDPGSALGLEVAAARAVRTKVL